MRVVLGTRGSKLALVQTEQVRDLLIAKKPEWEIEIKVISTKGDRIQHLPLDKIGDKGLFVQEIEQQLLSGEITIGVHSLKDLPSELEPGLCLAPPLKGADWRDALILRSASSLAELKPQAVIGTGSKRRKFQLLSLRPDLKVVDIRGNIDTRLRKMEELQLDGLVLAAAGLQRLDLEDRITERFDADQMVPASGQGILALEVRKDQTELLNILEELSDPETAARMEAERSFLAAVGGSCHIPAGAHLELLNREQAVLHAVLGSEDGEKLLHRKMVIDRKSAGEAAAELAQAMKRELVL